MIAKYGGWGQVLVVEDVDEVVVVRGYSVSFPSCRLWYGFLGCLGKLWCNSFRLDCLRCCLQSQLCVMVIELRQLRVDVSFVFDWVKLAISLILRVPWLEFGVSVPQCKRLADVVGLEVIAILVVKRR